jgi:hypothetical protein
MRNVSLQALALRTLLRSSLMFSLPQNVIPENIKHLLLNYNSNSKLGISESRIVRIFCGGNYLQFRDTARDVCVRETPFQVSKLRLL